MASEFTKEIKRNVGELSSTAKGWKREINLISWNKKPVKIDIREWSPDHEKMGKGIALNKQELIKLKEILDLEFDSLINDLD